MIITFILSVLNGRNHLQRCLDSIYAQTSPDWEIIVIDGGSTDGTLQILQENSDRLSYWISEPDRGIYDAWNKALPHVNGEWFHFLGTDDRLWNNHVVETAKLRLENVYPSHRIAYGQVYTAFADGSLHALHGEDWSVICSRFTQEMCIPHQGTFHHRSLIETGRRFDIALRFAADYDFLISEFQHRPPIFLPDFIVAVWELGGATSTPRHALTVCRDMMRAQKRHGPLPPGWRFRYAKAWAKSMAWQFLGPDWAARLIDIGRRATGRPALGRLDTPPRPIRDNGK